MTGHSVARRPRAGPVRATRAWLVGCVRDRSVRQSIARRLRMGFGGFSWKRAVGSSAAKARLSRQIGIPLTRSGRQQKLGRMISGGGCLVALGTALAVPAVIVAWMLWR